MLKNYLIIAWRNLRKHKGYSFLNLAGLAIGMTCCLLILLYVQDELSYDRFHPNGDRVYRACLDAAVSGQVIKLAVTAAPMAATLVREFPEVQNATRFWRAGRVLVSYSNNRFYEENFLWADSTAFEVFGFPLVQGDPKTALAQPNSMVLTEAMSHKYFGKANPLGQTLRLDNRTDYKVTGVLQDVSHNTHLRFDFLASLISREQSAGTRWVSNNYYTYILLRPGADPEQLEAKFPALVRKYVAPQIEQALGKSYDEAVAAGAKWDFFLQPLPDIYWRADLQYEIGATSDIKYMYILTAIAIFILLIACINFMNLATARAANRAKEVGMRKVLGSVRGQLIKQFLSEAILLACLAMLIALLLMEALLPAFNHLAGKELSLAFGKDFFLLLTFAGIALATGFVAGIYPAFVLSGFQPVAVLKGALRSGIKSPWLRSTLVVTQFAISIVLLIGTGVVYNQLHYMRDKNLGFNKEQVVVLPIETREGLANYQTFRHELLRNPSIIEVAATSGVPGRFLGDNAHRPEGAPPEVVYSLQTLGVSVDYLNTMGMQLAAGRDFSPEHPTDSTEAFIINETAARVMGWEAQTAVGKHLTALGPRNDERTIVGVVKDFHFESLHLEIKPLVMSIDPLSFIYIAVRLRPQNVSQALSFLQEKWQAYEPGYPWRYFFLDEDFGRLFEREERQSQIFGTFTTLAIFIACLGLFGLASFVAEQRTKEIGIRKVLGASLAGIVGLLSKDFVKLVLVANIIAWPVAYFAIHRWLQNFAYRVEIGWWVFALAGGIALLIALLTVSMQALKAALANPVEALRYE